MSDLRSALESALDEAPDDAGSWMAYADHLAEQGDPRGELMQVHLALEDATRPPAERKELERREKALIRQHQRQWLGPLAGPLLDEVPSQHEIDFGQINFCRWGRGGLSELRLHQLDLETARTLVACSAARFLRKLELLHTPEYDFRDMDLLPGDGVTAPQFSALCVLLRAPFLPHLRYLRVGEEVDFDSDEGFDSDQPSARGLADLLAHTPRLEELHVLARDQDLGRLFALPLPRLRTLLVYHEARRYPLAVLAGNAGMPALEVLRLHPASSFTGPLLRRVDVAEFVRSPHFPALRELHLHASNLGNPGCRDLVDSGILKRLRVLNLRHGVITDLGAMALAACPDARRLELLNVADNRISEVGAAVLISLGINVVIGTQHEAGSDEYLFSGDME